MTQWPGAVDLGGSTWEFGSVPPTPLWQGEDQHLVRDWQAASVPGNLEADRAALGLAGDPCGSDVAAHEREVENRDWWYRRRTGLPVDNSDRCHVVLHGMDYYSAVQANGVQLGAHEGMFSRQVYDVTDILRQNGRRLDLAVRLWGAHALPKRQLTRWQRLAEPLVHRVAGDTDMFPARIETLKCQMSFGWDFAPRLPTIGLWDEVEAVISGPVFISDLWVRATPRGQDADVALRLQVDSTVRGAARLTLHVQGENCEAGEQDFSYTVALSGGSQTIDVGFVLAAARRWQPWDRGEPNLYRLTAGLEPEGALLLSSATTVFGVRTIEMAANSQAPSQAAWTFAINGQREFIRGVNWTPADVLPGRVRAKDYDELIGMARQANANLLRVWGGGLREKRAFYDLCDREGLLVWQEFPFACPNLRRYPTSEQFMSLVQHEVTDIVRTLRNHPSVVLWCGGNEFSPGRNARLVETIQDAVARADGTRPFRAASPSAGDRHNWRVWHRFAPLSDCAKEARPFVSEFGLQAAPDTATLATFIPEAQRWPPGGAWTRHHAELAKLQWYARAFLPASSSPAQAPDDALCAFVEATQKAQALGVQIMVEHMRRRAPAASGVIVWQLNEPWPSICWSLISHDRQPKLAYHVLRRIFSPLLVSVEYTLRHYRRGDPVDLRLWVINDGGEVRGENGQTASLRVMLNRQEVHRQSLPLPLQSGVVSSLRVVIPNEPAPWLLRIELWRGKDMLAVNEYDLSYHDERRMPLKHRLLAWLGQWLLR